MTISPIFSDVLIEGNTIGVGAGTSSGTPVYFGYGASASLQDGYIIFTNADCRIVNNYVSGAITDANTFMMGLRSCSCHVQGNTFVREAAAITAYIINAGPDDHTIVDNIFDGYTVDGSTSQEVSPLVVGLSANSRYTNNKNQMAWAIIPLGTNKTAINKASNGSFTPFGIYATTFYNTVDTTLGSSAGVASGAFWDDYVLELFDSTASPAQRTFTLGVDISANVPHGAKIIDAKYSVYNPSSVPLNTSGTNQFNLALSAGRNHLQSIDVKTYSSGGTLSWMLGFNANAGLTINAGNEASMRSAYQVIEIPTLNFTGTQTDSSGTTTSVSNVDISSNYVAGNDAGLTAKLFFSYQATSTGSFSPFIPLIVVSPLIVTYVF